MRAPKKIIAASAVWLVLASGMVFVRAGEQGGQSTSGMAVDPSRPRSGEQGRNLFETATDSKKSCTIIYASDGTTALAGNNEDWSYHLNDIWFLPPEEGKFGRAYFGLKFTNGEHMPQGGMNDQGLFYDGASAEPVLVSQDSSTFPFDGDPIQKAMEECSTVEEVLKLYEQYHVSVGDGQLLIGDRFGNSAIMEATGNIIRKQGDFQIATNFFQSRTKQEDITDTRYRMAEELFDTSENISVDLFRRILNATHWEEYSGSMTVTLYSYICDLKNGDIYIYHFHNFEDVVKINLREELKKGERYLSISSLFPYETYAAKRHKAQWTLEFLIERARDKGVEGNQGAIALFRDIKSGRFDDYRLRVVEGHLNALGYELLANDETENAIEVFKYEVSEYPESANAYDSLGEAYLKNGDTRKAIENYKKSLELNPENDNARNVLTTIDEE